MKRLHGTSMGDVATNWSVPEFRSRGEIRARARGRQNSLGGPGTGPPTSTNSLMVAHRDEQWVGPLTITSCRLDNIYGYIDITCGGPNVQRVVARARE